MSNEPLEKRTWVFVQPPAAYSIAGCSCGNQDCQWSEYVGHLWCANCSKDFRPEHNGIFDGPIPVHLSRLLGIVFDRMMLDDRRIIQFDIEGSNDDQDLSDSVQA